MAFALQSVTLIDPYTLVEVVSNHLQTIDWEDRKLSTLTALAWPIAISMLSHSLMTVADTYFVGTLGTAELAGVGMANTILWATICFSMGLLRAVKVMVSQARGADQLDQTKRYFFAGKLLALSMGVVLLALTPLIVMGLRKLLDTAESAEAGASYFAIRMLSTPLFLMFVAAREYRYGMGDSRLPMVAGVSANILNVVLDYVFIMKLGWGVEGAAWATLAGTALEWVILLIPTWRSLWEGRNAQWVHARSTLDVGVPSGVQFTLEMGAFTLLAVMIARLGDIEMAAHQIALQLTHVAFLPVISVGEGASVMAGQAVGARRDELVLPVSKLAMKMGFVYMAVCSFVFMFLGEPLSSLFAKEEGLVEVTASLLVMAAFFILADAPNIVSRCVLRGLGDVKVPAMIGIALSWVCTPPLMWLFGYELGLGALGGWLGLSLEVFLSAGILGHRLFTGRWLPAAHASRDRQARTEGEQPVAA